MKYLFKLSILAIAIVFFTSCQKQLTASFSPMKGNAYHDYSNAKTTSISEQSKENIEEEDFTKEIESSNIDFGSKNTEKIKELIPVASPESNKSTSIPDKVSKKEAFKQLKAVKKQMKTNGNDKNTNLFLIVLLVLLLLLLLGGNVLYWVLVALVVWLILYLLGVI